MIGDNIGMTTTKLLSLNLLLSSTLNIITYSIRKMVKMQMHNFQALKFCLHVWWSNYIVGLIHKT